MLQQRKMSWPVIQYACCRCAVDNVEIESTCSRDSAKTRVYSNKAPVSVMV